MIQLKLNPHRLVVAASVFSLSILVATEGLANGWNPNSKATIQNSIEFTRHNLTLSYNIDAGSGAVMELVHNQYGDSYPDKDEPRMYNSGENVEVECASCPDPHGVPSAGQGSEFISSFLRISNGNANTGAGVSSGLCLTCHIKQEDHSTNNIGCAIIIPPAYMSCHTIYPSKI